MLESNKLYRANLILKEYKALTLRNGRYNESQKLAKYDFEYRFFNPTDADIEKYNFKNRLFHPSNTVN